MLLISIVNPNDYYKACIVHKKPHWLKWVGLDLAFTFWSGLGWIRSCILFLKSSRAWTWPGPGHPHQNRRWIVHIFDLVDDDTHRFNSILFINSEGREWDRVCDSNMTMLVALRWGPYLSSPLWLAFCFLVDHWSNGISMFLIRSVQNFCYDSFFFFFWWAPHHHFLDIPKMKLTF